MNYCLFIILFVSLLLDINLYSYSSYDNLYQSIGYVILTIFVVFLMIVIGSYSERKKKKKEIEENRIKILNSVLDDLNSKNIVFLKDVIIKHKITRKEAEYIFDKIVKDYGFNMEVDENGEIYINVK